ncbi:MAG: hypothetical protein QXU32_02000 [Nitrososphaerales archaeon]
MLHEFLNLYYVAACLVIVVAVVGMYFADSLVNFWHKLEEKFVRLLRYVNRMLKRGKRRGRTASRGRKRSTLDESASTTKNRRRNKKGGYDYSFLDM